MARRPVRASRDYRKIKSIMRRLPQASHDEILTVLQHVAPRLVNYIKLRTPVRTGALSRGVKSRLARRSLKLKVGILGSPKARGKLFYGYILNWGRKAQTVQAKRRNASGTLSRYPLKVRALKGSRFVTGAGRTIRTEVEPQLKGIWTKILRRAAGGE